MKKLKYTILLFLFTSSVMGQGVIKTKTNKTLPSVVDNIPTQNLPNYKLVSRDSISGIIGSFFESWEPTISKDLSTNARFVVFISQAKGICGSSGKYRQLFWKDRATGRTEMISKSPTGEEANGNCFAPAVSASGIKLAFESYASNLVPNDGNGVRDIFLWKGFLSDYSTPNIERVSVGANGEEANAQSFEPSISGLGEEIVFSSNATNIADGGVEVSGVNVYLRMPGKNKTELISKDYKTGKGVGGSKPSIDLHGRKIAFWSYAYTLVEDDKNNLWDIFLYERNNLGASLPLKRITMAHNGGERNQGDESSSRVVTPYISGNGEYISYATTSSNVVENDNNNTQDAFLYHIATNTTTRISVNNNGEEGNAASPSGQGEKIELSFNGTKAVFTTMASNFGMPANNIVLYDAGSKKIQPVTSVKNTYVSTPSICRFGKYVAFGCGLPLDKRFNSSGLFVVEIK